MGSKNKLKRFRDNDSFENVIQPSRQEILEGFEFKGRWNTIFSNPNPIVLELGCGKGEYTLALAERYPEKNFIGIDIKGARLWRGAKTALENKLPNVRFLRMNIELIDAVFDESEVSEIWITFPDPQIKYKRTKHRLTNIHFLDRYKKILDGDGLVHLKTDSEFLHGYTLGLLQGLDKEIVYSNNDVYRQSGSPAVVTEVQTFYESQYLEMGKPITYLSFKI
ncbi:MAG: tRNA (guanosine(46)-N7)-methyltransferase TrmB [Flavobacteriaceae bacterium]